MFSAMASVASARSPIEAKLVIPSTKILPGVPFEMSIEVHNASETTLTVATCDMLRYRPVDGVVNYECNRACFDWYQSRWQRAKNAKPDASAVIKPGEGATLFLAIHDGLKAPHIEDEIGLSKAAGHTMAIAVQLCVLNLKDEQPIVTNEVDVQLVEPAGADAEVWKRMNELTDGTWTPRAAGLPEGHALWGEVIANHPDSNYMPYAVLAMSGGVDQMTLDRILETIRRFPDSPVIEHLRTRRAAVAKSLAPPP